MTSVEDKSKLMSQSAFSEPTTLHALAKRLEFVESSFNTRVKKLEDKQSAVNYIFSSVRDCNKKLEELSVELDGSMSLLKEELSGYTKNVDTDEFTQAVRLKQIQTREEFKKINDKNFGKMIKDVEKKLDILQKKIHDGRMCETDTSRYVYQGILPLIISQKLSENAKITREKVGKYAFQDKEFSGNWKLVTEGTNIYFCEYRPGTKIREGRGAWWNGKTLVECYWKNNDYHGLYRQIQEDGSYYEAQQEEGGYKWNLGYNKYGEQTFKGGY